MATTEDKMALIVPCVAIRGSTGISITQGPPTYEPVSLFTKDDSKVCKTMAFSPMGRYFTWVNGSSVKVVLCETWQVVAEIHRCKVQSVKFSPQDTYLMTWEPFIVSANNSQGGPNLFFWNPENGELIKCFIHKKQIDWEPQWSIDEKICGLLVNNDVVLYEESNFDDAKAFNNKMNVGKIAKFSIAPGAAPYHIVCHMPGKSGPSFGRLFRYPKLPANQPVANKSFFQDDRVDFYWNNQGTSVLLLASTEVDNTGASYYGKQTLHYLDTKGETALVTLSKEGPIHAVQWSPKQTEFIVIYGLMPSKATIYNLQCEPVFEFGTKHRNAIYYNPHGNIVILTGFGNLRGEIELWDTVNRKLIATSDAPDSTLLEWSPDGEHYMTATTAPRLRMSNGFKIWHYTGTLLYERPWNKQEELWEVLWQKFPSDLFKEKPIKYKAVGGIAPSQPQASKQAYRPPSARGKTINFKLHDDVDDPKPSESIPSKNFLKVKKKREAKKAKKEQEAALSQTQSGNVTANGQTNSITKVSSPTTSANYDLTNDPEKNKKIKKINIKLEQISKLKEQQVMGKQLEINQLNKIKKEAELIKELEELIL
ncbi:PREDICTED: eukaryotic translation initiation factor 2A [Ceratosolen solmsi marchali]|uniref:Eukaryotic translation initiation factor 2A n=1 Tax=Ceratosolen solmsi marchali TaxID=326594 RepID=A0AAJ7E2Z6_9HYME|nr:PREDICTED: eukaryotic translation initiation factor 2A [Ceratosolen solmsi marchali]